MGTVPISWQTGTVMITIRAVLGDSDNFLRFTVVVEPDRPDFIQDLQIFYTPRPVDFPPKSGYVVAVLSNFDPPFAGRIGSFLALRLENRIDAATASRP
jgi:hypothetical protein